MKKTCNGCGANWLTGARCCVRCGHDSWFDLDGQEYSQTKVTEMPNYRITESQHTIIVELPTITLGYPRPVLLVKLSALEAMELLTASGIGDFGCRIARQPTFTDLVHCKLDSLSILYDRRAPYLVSKFQGCDVLVPAQDAIALDQLVYAPDSTTHHVDIDGKRKEMSKWTAADERAFTELQARRKAHEANITTSLLILVDRLLAGSGHERPGELRDHLAASLRQHAELARDTLAPLDSGVRCEAPKGQS